MGFIRARGSNFYYEEKGDGAPVLLIPPAGSTASTWGTLVGDLAGAGRVIAYDRRGYTRSGGGVARSAAEHTRDAAAVLDALEAGTSSPAPEPLTLAAGSTKNGPCSPTTEPRSAGRRPRVPSAPGSSRKRSPKQATRRVSSAE